MRLRIKSSCLAGLFLLLLFLFTNMVHAAPPVLQSADYVAGRNELLLYFDQEILSLGDPSAGVSLTVDGGGENTVVIASPWSYAISGTRLSITLQTTTAASVESWSGRDTELSLSMDGGLIQNSLEEQSTAVTFTDIFPVGYVPPLQIVSADYVPEYDRLSFSFSSRIDDASVNNYGNIKLTTDPVETDTLVVKKPWRFFTGKATDDSIIHIELTDSLARRIESWESVSDGLKCEVDSGIVYSLGTESDEIVPNDSISFFDGLYVAYKPLPPGVVGEWYFSEGTGSFAYDTSDYNNDGTLESGVEFVSGQNAVSLDGNGYVIVADSPGLDNLNQLTISMWIKRNRLNTAEHLIAKGHSEKTYALSLTETNTLEFSVFLTDFTERTISSVTKIDTGSWHHITAVYNHSGMGLYVDGTRDVWSQFMQVSPAIASNGNDLVIGGNENNMNSFAGSIGHTVLFNDSLTDTRIDSLYQADRAVYGNVAPVAPENVDALYSNVIDTQSVRFEWGLFGENAYAADSVGIWWSNDTFPSFAHDEGAIGYKSIPAGIYTTDITDLTGGQNYYFSIAVKDTSGHWSAMDSSSMVKAFVPEYHGPVWYVDASSTSPGTGRKTSPFDNLHRAMLFLQNGDTVRVARGQYIVEASIFIDKDSLVLEGGYDNDFLFRNADTLSSVLLPGPDLLESMIILMTVEPGFSKIDGFVFENHAYPCIQVSSSAQENTHVTNNRFVNCSGVAIDLPTANRVFVRNNIFALCKTGIKVGGGNALRIENNTFFNNEIALNWGTCEEGVFKNNIVSNSHYALVEREQYATLDSLQYNCFYESVPCSTVSGFQLSLEELNSRAGAMQNLSLPPHFRDPIATPADLHLSKYSSCIDAGDPASVYAREPFPNGQRVNLGAYGNTIAAAITDPYPYTPEATFTQDTVIGKKAVISWKPLSWMDQGDSIFVHIDTVNRSGGWELTHTLPYDAKSCTLTVDAVGSYTYMVSTSRDSAGVIDERNALVDALVFSEYADLTAWYVDASMTGEGNGSLASPFAEISQAFSRVNDEDTIYVAQGEYPVSDDAGITSQGVVIKGGYLSGFDLRDPRAYPTIIDGRDSLFGVFLQLQNGCEIDGVAFNRINSVVVDISYASQVKVSRCFFSDCANPIRIQESDTVLVSNTVIVQSGVGVDFINEKARFVSIRSNTFVNNSGSAISLFGSVTEIKNNIFDSNAIALKSENGASSPLLYNCFFENSYTFQDASTNTVLTVEELNLWDGNQGNILANPNITDTTLYRVGANSPCIDAGDPLSPYENEPLPNGGRINIGAYGNSPYAAVTIEQQPQNNVSAHLVAEKDTGVSASLLVPDTLSSQIQAIGAVLSYETPVGDYALLNHYPVADTIIRKKPITQYGWWYFSWACKDERGNYSDIKTDSVRILSPQVNHPVVDSLITDTSLVENQSYECRMYVSDADSGDSIYAEITGASWIEHSVSKVDENHWLIYAFGVVPDGYEASAEYTIRATDKSGASTEKMITLSIAKANENPRVHLRKKNHNPSWGAISYQMSGEDDQDSIIRFIGILNDHTQKTKDTVVSTSGHFQWYPLMNGEYSFSCVAVDYEELVSESPYIDTFGITGATSHVFADSGAWQMVSIPAREKVADIFTDFGHVLRWDETQDEDQIYKFYVRGKDIHHIDAGQGYWLKAESSVSVSIQRDDLVDSNYIVNLTHKDYGWNQVSSPYPFPIKWPGDEILWKWNNETGDYQEVNNVLFPWEGYWVQTDQARSVVLQAEPVFESNSLAKKAMTFFAGRNEWQIQVKLSDGIFRDENNIIGFNPSAENGKDELDKPEPPRMAEYPCLFINRPDWNPSYPQHASDIRKVLQDDKIEAFELAILSGRQSAGPLQFSIQGVSKLQGVYLYYGDQTGMMPITNDTSFVLAKQNKTMYKTIFAASNPHILNRIPQKFGLALPYPNPARRAACIKYQLPYRWSTEGRLNKKKYPVSINIHDVRGRVVRQLVHRPQAPGFHQVVWDGRGNSGNLVAAGTYFCRLQAGDHSGMRRITLLR